MIIRCRSEPSGNFLKPIPGADAESGVQIGIVQIGQIDREIVDVHSHPAGEIADIESGPPEHHLAIPDLQAEMRIERYLPLIILRRVLDALELDVAGARQPRREIVLTIVQHGSGLDRRQYRLGGAAAVADKPGADIGYDQPQPGVLMNIVQRADIERQTITGDLRHTAIDDAHRRADVYFIFNLTRRRCTEHIIAVGFLANHIVAAGDRVEIGDLDATPAQIIKIKTIRLDRILIVEFPAGIADIVMIEKRAECLGVHGDNILTGDIIQPGRIPVSRRSIERPGHNRSAHRQSARPDPQRERLPGIFGGIRGEGK